MKRIQAGDLLISDPFLKDPHFSRAVILLCEHNEEGSFGLILNKPYTFRLNELLEQMEDIDWDVFTGGPVQKDSIHFIHTVPEWIGDGLEILPGIFWGGDFQDVITSVLKHQIQPEQIKFFVGYSGWSAGQLASEMEEQTWLNVKANKNLLFNTLSNDVWKEALKHMGGKYAQMVNYPIDPQLN